MTVGFARNAAGKVVLTVNAWRARERGRNNLPVRDFKRQFSRVLR
jgi:hypothetical protein